MNTIKKIGIMIFEGTVLILFLTVIYFLIIGGCVAIHDIEACR